MNKNIWSGKTRIVLYLSFLIGILGTFLLPFASAQLSTTTQNTQAALCSVISEISFVLSILALMLFILGGTLYAFAHFLPATGNFRGSMQAWGMGMLMGGIISLILYILAPFIVGKIESINPNSGIQAPTCSTSTGTVGASSQATGTGTIVS
ncbi:MAG: hypothetical protein QXD23_00795 [Candidatus Micrarchaeaceae archaeon]